MSRMQDALFRKDYDCPNPAVPVPDLSEPDNQEGAHEGCNVETLCESKSCHLRRNPILWVVPNPPTRAGRPTGERTARLKSNRVRSANAPNTRKRSETKKVSALHNESPAGQSLHEENESLAARIRHFQERADLRECLLPGMLGGVSRNACEGWQRQESVRNSRMLAKIKLEPCKNCRYGLESALAKV